MPLNCHDGERGMGERFNRAVGSLADGEKFFSKFIDCLMMGGIDEGAASV